MKESKIDRFRRVAEARVNKIIKMIRLLGNAPKRAYMSTRMHRWNTSFQRCNPNWTKPKGGSESHCSENIVFH